MQTESATPSVPTDTTQLFRRLRGGGAWVVAGRTAGMATVLASYMYLALLVGADVLPKAEFAAFGLVSSIVSFFSMAAMFGLNTLVCRYVSESFSVGDADRALAALGITLRLAAASVGVAGGLAWLTLKLLGDSVFDMPLVGQYSGLIACWIMLLAISQVVAEVFRGLHDLRAASILSGVSGGLAANAVFLLSIIVVSCFVRVDFFVIVVVFVLSLLLATALAAVYLQQVWPKATASAGTDHDLALMQFGTVVRDAWPVMLVQLFGFGMAQLDIWVVAVCCSPAELAVYIIIRRLSLLMAIPLTQVSLAVSSSIAELYARGDRHNLQRVVRGAATVGAVFAGLPAMVLVTFPSPILGLVFGQAFQGGSQALRIMLLGQLFFALTGPCGPALMMTGHQRVSLWSLLSALPVFAIAPWAAVDYGLEGVAAVFAVAISIQNLIQWIVVARLLGIATQPCFTPRYVFRLLSVT